MDLKVLSWYFKTPLLQTGHISGGPIWRIFQT